MKMLNIIMRVYKDDEIVKRRWKMNEIHKMTKKSKKQPKKWQKSENDIQRMNHKKITGNMEDTSR